MTIIFKAMCNNDIPLWNAWIKNPHVANTWFLDGYEIADYICQKIEGNGYDYPFIAYLAAKPIAYIQCSDLYAYRTKCPAPKGVFTKEEPGTYCIDLFIGDEQNLNKGYGTLIIKAFIDYIFKNFAAEAILIDPAASNTHAIHCYEKAGFSFVKKAFDSVTECYVMQCRKKHGD